MKWFQNIIIGCLIGLSVSYVVVTISTLLGDSRVLTGEELLEELILAIMLGAVIGAATMLFNSDRWSFRFILILHFLIVVASVYIAGAFGGWYDMNNFISIIALFCEVVFIYILVWGIMLLLEKREVENINRLIKKK
ncbi:DUF3021 domain-containing protein [Solibacillus silvestris]|uniref:DUF3021 domain-containing protein n=1 Tax=Solibacillus silvestris TaxID=76853 RepID=UPI003F7E67A7